ncbi:MAG: hypothetical protein KME26_22675 [Oscillatoria princeps RMCB-10]|nr:hypothetical protein [Oscillatoria princeps RMCB-10]
MSWGHGVRAVPVAVAVEHLIEKIRKRLPSVIPSLSGLAVIAGGVSHPSGTGGFWGARNPRPKSGGGRLI